MQSKNLGPEAQIVTVVPDIATQQLQPGDEFILLACDGIWDVLTNQEARLMLSLSLWLCVNLLTQAPLLLALQAGSCAVSLRTHAAPVLAYNALCSVCRR